MTRRSQRGFTLIEMMVVVAIIALLSGTFIALSARTFGTNADSMSDEIAADLMFARSRSISTRRWHEAVITPQSVILFQSTTIGMVTPTAWQQVQVLTIPNGTSIWDAQTTIWPNPGGAGTITQNTSLNVTYLFRPDGSSSGGTIFVTDKTGARQFRILMYKVSGGVYSRAAW